MSNCLKECERCTTPFTLRHATTRFCSRVCYDAGRAVPVRICQQCGIAPVKTREAKYCSPACAVSAIPRLPSIPCGMCGTVFKQTKMSRKYCTLACAGAAIRVPLPSCRHCGVTITSRARIYCSRACSASARRHAKGNCKTCNATLRRAGMIYCSLKCRPKPTHVLPPCKVCGGSLRRGSVAYCSQACASIGRFPPAFCVVCDKPKRRGRRSTCSSECYVVLSRRTINPVYTPELLETVRVLRADGKPRDEIATHVGITTNQLDGLLGRRKFPAPQKITAPIVPKPPKALKASVSTGSPRGIPLREVMRWGADLGLPYAQRGDVDAVSRAMRRADPSHPGFRLVDPLRYGRRAA